MWFLGQFGVRNTSMAQILSANVLYLDSYCKIFAFPSFLPKMNNLRVFFFILILARNGRCSISGTSDVGGIKNLTQYSCFSPQIYPKINNSRVLYLAVVTWPKSEMFYVWNIRTRSYKKSDPIFLFVTPNLPKHEQLPSF